MRGFDFDVRLLHRARNDDDISVSHVIAGMTNHDFAAQPPQPPGYCVFSQIGSLHLIAEIQQHFGNATHPGTADADEVNTIDSAHSINHGVTPATCRQTSAIEPSASGRASLRALSARTRNSSRVCPSCSNAFFSDCGVSASS